MLLWHPLCITNTGVRSAAAFVAISWRASHASVCSCPIFRNFQNISFWRKTLDKSKLVQVIQKMDFSA